MTVPFPTQPPAAPRPSWRQRLMQGFFPVPPGILSPEQTDSAQAQGLLHAGLGLLEMGGPAPVAPSLGQAIAHGVRRGQDATNRSVQNGLLVDDRRVAMQRQQARDRVAQMFPVSPSDTREQTIDKLRGMMTALLSVGDVEGAGKISEYLKSVDNASEGSIKEIVGPDGKPAFGVVTPQGARPIPGAAPYQRPPAGAGKRLEPMVNPKTNKPELAIFDPNDGSYQFTGITPPSNRDSAATEGERKGSVLYQIAQPSSLVLDELDAPHRLAQITSKAGLQEFLTENQQLLDLHSMVVADAYIRLTSGANAPEPEVERAFKMIAPRAGDSRRTIEEKRKIRQRFIRALQTAAGRAMPRGGSPAATATPSTGGNRLLNP